MYSSSNLAAYRFYMGFLFIERTVACFKSRQTISYCHSNLHLPTGKFNTRMPRITTQTVLSIRSRSIVVHDINLTMPLPAVVCDRASTTPDWGSCRSRTIIKSGAGVGVTPTLHPHPRAPNNRPTVRASRDVCKPKEMISSCHG